MMIKDRHLTDSKLTDFFMKLEHKNSKIDNNLRIEAMLLQQMDPILGWQRLRSNMEIFSKSPIAEVKVKGIPVKLVLNKTRTPSIKSNTFEKKADNTIHKRCLLCELGKGQRGILIEDEKYIVLANPGITLPGDLTISSVKHEKQILTGHFQDMVEIATNLFHLSIYFNGALAGASSPHFHFQAGQKDKLIGEQQIQTLLAGKSIGNTSLNSIISTNNFRLFSLKNYLRTGHIFTTKNPKRMVHFIQFYSDKLLHISKKNKINPNIPNFGEYVNSLQDKESEGRMNIMLKYYPESDEYIAAFFPKRTSRPKCYFKKGKNQIILGIAIKESLGNLITCRKKDFEILKNSPDLIEEAYRDTSITKNMLLELNEFLKDYSL